MENRDFTYWCELPKPLGRVVKMRSVGDRIVCETSSGIPFITPLYGVMARRLKPAKGSEIL